MPVMDGYELVRQLRADPETNSIPVIFYTAHYSDREARALATSSGVQHVLTKPVRSAEVLKVVASVLKAAAAGGRAPATSPLTMEFDREHLRLLTDKISEKVGDLYAANEQLRALINIGVELASEGGSARRLENVCASARALFNATYATVGIINVTDQTLQHMVVGGSITAQWLQPGETIPGIPGRVVREGRALRGNNPHGDPTTLNLPASHPDVKAFLAAPIAASGHVYGWICLTNNEGRIFSDDDEQLLLALAGQVGRIYELEHEVLERKQAELAVRQERDGAQRYLDTAQVILLALDSNARVTLANRYASSVLEWPADELLGRDWIDTCIPERYRLGIHAYFRSVISGGRPILENVSNSAPELSTVLTRSGAERLIEWRNTAVRDDAGRIVGTFSSGLDITERTHAIDALRTSEERVRYALEASGVGIWDMDFKTGVLQWSDILQAQYGLEPGTFAGTFESFIGHVHPGDRAELLRAMTLANASGEDFTVNHRALWADGTVRWLSGAGRVHLDEDRQPVRGVGISLDVTEKRTLELQYQQAQKMEAIGRLAGGVAHDFNNLLTVILGNCELMMTDIAPADPHLAEIAEIQHAGTSAAALTRQLLAFSRKDIIEPTLLDLNHVVKGMQGMLGRLIGEDVKIVLGLSAKLGSVKADRGQLEQVVMNLAVNARDAMPAGGTLTIETADVELDEHYADTYVSVQPGPYVLLAISDTGSGMTPEVQARLFEPFFTTKEAGKGTGLGLATVHGIATASGGSVNVDSQVGKGTSFKVYFPRLTRPELGSEPRVAVARPRSGTETVLVVEDAAGLRQLTRRLLQRQGYNVLVAANATEALEQFDGDVPIDVILTDVVMPGASGPELTRQLLERQPTLKVLFMSGYTEDAIVHRGVLNNGIAFLHKPFSSDALGKKIREVIDK